MLHSSEGAKLVKKFGVLTCVWRFNHWNVTQSQDETKWNTFDEFNLVKLYFFNSIFSGVEVGVRTASMAESQLKIRGWLLGLRFLGVGFLTSALSLNLLCSSMNHFLWCSLMFSLSSSWNMTLKESSIFCWVVCFVVSGSPAVFFEGRPQDVPAIRRWCWLHPSLHDDPSTCCTWSWHGAGGGRGFFGEENNGEMMTWGDDEGGNNVLKPKPAASFWSNQKLDLEATVSALTPWDPQNGCKTHQNTSCPFCGSINFGYVPISSLFWMSGHWKRKPGVSSHLLRCFWPGQWKGWRGGLLNKEWKIYLQ